MLTLGVIGDFGSINPHSTAVSTLVKSWSPSFILTTGDNIYSSPPSIKTYSSILGPLYSEYLPTLSFTSFPKTSVKLSISTKKYGKPIKYFVSTKFLPSVGNHDFPFPSYQAYFQLPTYYSTELVENVVKYISLNSYHDDGGKFEDDKSDQGSWLRDEVESSKYFKVIIVSFHYPQLCSNDNVVVSLERVTLWFLRENYNFQVLNKSSPKISYTDILWKV
jgi:hypothetical protein